MNFGLVKNRWSKAWHDNIFLILFITVIIYLAGLIAFFNQFFSYIQHRKGTVLPDVILAHIPTHNISPWLFLVLYSSLIIGIYFLLFYPKRMLQLLIAAAIVYTCRAITIWLIPLDPPAGCLPLRDPIIRHIAYGNVIVTKDLFFSGHVTILFLLFLSMPNRSLRILYFALMLLIIMLLLIQHAHYSIDILGAFFFSYGGWWISRLLLKAVPSFSGYV
jgi:PAP2 superfamily C-terminal